MNKFLLLGVLLLCSCHRKHDQVQEASQSNPDVKPPPGPICTQQPYFTNGGVGGPGSSYIDVTIPNYDESKGDTAIFQYKRWDSTTWITYQERLLSSPVKFKVAKSVVRITETGSQQWDWQINATIWTCS